MRFSFIVVFCLFLLVGETVFAQEEKKAETTKNSDKNQEIAKPGILPNSFWYWSDIFGEQLRFVFTLGKEKKGQYLLNLSDERSAEMKKLSESGVNDYAEVLADKQREDLIKGESLLAEAQGLTVDELKKDQANKKITPKEVLPSDLASEKSSAKKIFGSLKSWVNKVVGKADNFQEGESIMEK